MFLLDIRFNNININLDKNWIMYTGEDTLYRKGNRMQGIVHYGNRKMYWVKIAGNKLSKLRMGKCGMPARMFRGSRIPCFQARRHLQRKKRTENLDRRNICIYNISEECFIVRKVKIRRDTVQICKNKRMYLHIWKYHARYLYERYSLWTMRCYLLK